MRKIEMMHFVMLSIALVLSAAILPAGWFASMWAYFMALYTLIWFINHKSDHKWVRMIIKMF